MRNLLMPFGRRPWRLTIGGSLIVVALSALAINRVRPISVTEARQIAEHEFHRLPGSGAWAGRDLYEVRPYRGPSGTSWAVYVFDEHSGQMLAHIILGRSGEAIGTSPAVVPSPPKL